MSGVMRSYSACHLFIPPPKSGILRLGLKFCNVGSVLCKYRKNRLVALRMFPVKKRNSFLCCVTVEPVTKAHKVKIKQENWLISFIVYDAQLWFVGQKIRPEIVNIIIK